MHNNILKNRRKKFKVNVAEANKDPNGLTTFRNGQEKL
jgi:hypothetical protein